MRRQVRGTGPEAAFVHHRLRSRVPLGVGARGRREPRLHGRDRGRTRAAAEPVAREAARTDAQLGELALRQRNGRADQSLPDAFQLVLAHSTLLRAPAGRSREARSAAVVPASKPPKRERAKPSRRIATLTGAVSETP